MMSDASPDGDQKIHLNLAEVPAHVEKVHIDGIQLTDDKFVKQQVVDLFKARNFEELLYYTSVTKRRLVQLGIFHDVEPVIDIYRGPKSTGSLNEEWAALQGLDEKHRYSVHFRLRERKRVHATARTSCGAENSVQLALVAAMPNLFGRAAKLEIDYETGVTGSVGSKTLSFLCPWSAARPWIKWGVGVWSSVMDFMWGRFLEHGRGLYGELRFPSSIGAHQLRVEGLWRTVVAEDLSTPAAIRECSGDYLKPSVRHVLECDSRDDRTFPLHGAYLRSTSEIAGVPRVLTSTVSPGPSTVCHLRQECETSLSVPLAPWLVSRDWVDKWGVAVQTSLNVGLVQAQRPDSGIVNIADRFFVGGPLTLRGFEMRSVGPRTPATEGPSAALGSEAYYLAAVHLYSALPYFGRKYNSLTDAVRLHAFANAGNAQPFGNVTNREVWLAENRVSVGVGLAFRLAGIARIELNYCFPIRAMAGDRVVPGFQFGFGLSYV